MFIRSIILTLRFVVPLSIQYFIFSIYFIYKVIPQLLSQIAQSNSYPIIIIQTFHNMTQIQHEDSPYTESRTEKSPQKQPPYNINFRSNYSAYTHMSNIEIEYMRFKEESKKVTEAYEKEIEILKEELFRKGEEVENLKSTVIMNLKKQLNDAQRQNIKNFRECERQARELEKLRADNFNMQQDLEKQSKQRRTYFAKLDDMKEIKQVTKREIIEKDKIIRCYTEQNKKLEKELASCRLELQDLTEDINERQKRRFQSQSEYKLALQKNFVIERELKSLQLRHKDNQMMINSYREKIHELERQRQQLVERVEENQSRNVGSDRESVLHGQMLEIKALMDQVYNLMDERKSEGREMRKKFLASIACLEKTLPRK